MEINVPETTSLLSPVGEAYALKLQKIKSSGRPAEEFFIQYGNHNLTDASTWWDALAVCEYALDTNADKIKTADFFRMIFRDYDCNVSVDLNAGDYDWFWKKDQEIAERVAAFNIHGSLDHAFQYFSARRGYADKSKSLAILEKLASGNQYAQSLLGYYLWSGICGVTDKERGLQLMNSVTEPDIKVKVLLNKGYIACAENKDEDAADILKQLLKAPKDTYLTHAVTEFQAYLLDREEKWDEAASLYQELLKTTNSGTPYMRLAYGNLNDKVKDANPDKGMQLLEKAFCAGRYDAALSLAYYYDPDNNFPWADAALYKSWLEKGYLYNEADAAYGLSGIYLFQEKDIEKGVFYLDEAIAQGHVDALIRKAYLYQDEDGLGVDTEECVRLLKEAIDKGSAYAQYRLGVLYENGSAAEDGNPDYKTARDYFEQAAEAGLRYGCELAGRSYRYGYAGEPDPEKARMYFERGLEMQSGFCAVELAFLYEEGDGVEKDMQKGFDFCMKAAQLEYPYGMYRVGLYYEKGVLGDENMEEAFNWYQKSAAMENLDAIFRLGLFYKRGLGTEENPDKALEWLQKGADMESASCLTELALCYEKEYGVEENPAKAFEYMLKAAEQDYTYAQYKVGYYYMYGFGSLEANHATALEWYEKAIANDSTQALIEMGDYYLYDYDQLGQFDKAFPYYRKALDDNLVSEGLGICFACGYGTEKNEAEAFKYYLMAAEDGYVRAMYRTALCYYKGWGIKENPEEAYRWMNDAAQNEITPAAYYLGKMLLNGEGCTPDIETGLQWLRKAADDDDDDAQYEMGNCYLLGMGVEENPDVAMEWFEKAADNGHEQSLKIVGRRKRKI